MYQWRTRARTNERTNERQALLLLLLFAFFTSAHTANVYVCLFPFLFRPFSSLPLSLSIAERNSCVEYDYGRHRCGAHAFISYPFFWLIFFLSSPSSSSTSSSSSSTPRRLFFSLLLPSYHTLTHNVHWWRSERISFALEIAWMIFFSLALSLFRFSSFSP